MVVGTEQTNKGKNTKHLNRIFPKDYIHFRDLHYLDDCEVSHDQCPHLANGV